MSKNALIGASGFVGGNIFRQGEFNSAFTSANIQEIKNRTFDIVVCAGARAEKWKANLDPDSDRTNIENLISNLRQLTAKKFVLISTVDVYPESLGVDEATQISSEMLAPYGKHRFYLEEFTRAQFPNHTIIRLPGLIGAGLKKNFIFDMLHNQEALSLTHYKSAYQFYSLETVWEDIKLILHHGVNLVNFATPPLTVGEIAAECFGTTFENVSAQPPVTYDMHTGFSWIFNQNGNYIWSREKEVDSIKEFIKSERNSQK